VWVGHAIDRRTLGPGAAGGEVAAPIWGAYMKRAHGKFCGDFPAPKVPFQSTPFFGHYATTGVKDNKVDPSSYETDKNGGSGLETGKDKAKDGEGTGNGGTTQAPAGTGTPTTPTQTTPQTQTPAATTTPATQTPQTPATPQTPDPGTTGAAGGTAPPP
jgi:penicillin-binding protein 1A